ncbi:hypothetical protein D3C78_1692300 [compost metagenome]
MESEIKRLDTVSKPLTLKDIGNIAAKAVQPKVRTDDGREAGTLYSTFINITDMEFVMIYKLDNSKMTKLNLNEVFKLDKARMIVL